MRRVRVFVRGQVQGVFFRQSAAHEATLRHVSGFARNLVDGRVEAVFQGEETAVQEMIEWCHLGPPAAVVEGVEVREEPPDPAEEPFRSRW